MAAAPLMVWKFIFVSWDFRPGTCDLHQSAPEAIKPGIHDSLVSPSASQWASESGLERSSGAARAPAAGSTERWSAVAM